MSIGQFNLILILTGLCQVRGLTFEEPCNATLANIKYRENLPGPKYDFLCSVERGLHCENGLCVCAPRFIWDTLVKTPRGVSPFAHSRDRIKVGECRRPKGGTCYDGVICITGTTCQGADLIKKTEGLCV